MPPMHPNPPLGKKLVPWNRSESSSTTPLSLCRQRKRVHLFPTVSQLPGSLPMARMRRSLYLIGPTRAGHFSPKNQTRRICALFQSSEMRVTPRRKPRSGLVPNRGRLHSWRHPSRHSPPLHPLESQDPRHQDSRPFNSQTSPPFPSNLPQLPRLVASYAVPWSAHPSLRTSSDLQP